MHGGRVVRRVGLGLGLALVLAAVQGCTDWRGGVGGYLNNRYRDACDTIDFGVTVSKKAQFAAYGCFASVAGGGYGRVEGEFYGIGRGNLGRIGKYYEYSWGIGLYGVETLGWGNEEGCYDPSDISTLSQQGVGPLGPVLGPWKARRPGSAPA